MKRRAAVAVERARHGDQSGDRLLPAYHYDFMTGLDLVQEFREALGQFLGFGGFCHTAKLPPLRRRVESGFADVRSSATDLESLPAAWT